MTPFKVKTQKGLEIRYLIKQYRKTHKYISIKTESESNLFNMKEYKIKVYNHWLIIKSQSNIKQVYVFPLNSIIYISFYP